MRAAGVASTRRYVHPETVLRRVGMQCDATVAGRATPRRDRPPAHRSGAAPRGCQIMPRCIAPPRRQTVQTVGDDACRSISIDCAHDAGHLRAGSRLK
ncbi:hypothetical protein C7S15_0095 [Burkholderia cepacia]|nr:hypothetical protein [Burkholderia cepacia]